MTTGFARRRLQSRLVSRLSQAISEGDGISIIVEVPDADTAGKAEQDGAEGLAVRRGADAVRAATQLPLLHLGGTAAASEASSDAVVVARTGRWDEARALGLECVVRVHDADDLERALTSSTRRSSCSRPRGSEEDPLEVLLALLHDVPAGKLAIAELADATATTWPSSSAPGWTASSCRRDSRRSSAPSRRTCEARGGLAVRIGILTGGGDCPGLNAVIRAVVRRSTDRGHEMVAIRDGWRGLTESIFTPLGRYEVSGILPRGGTILGTTRTNPYKVDAGVEAVLKNFEEQKLDALVAVGGEDTLGVAARLHREHELPIVGVPKTIDNDLSGTDYTFGFDTAVTIATEVIDRLHTTAESHNRVMVVEVMGRHTGWIAVMSGIAGGADVILIPEQPITVEDACRELVKRHDGRKGLLDRGRQRGLRADLRVRRASPRRGRGARD